MNTKLNKTTFFLACCALIISGSEALAASFDCTKAATSVEKMICADNNLSELDEKLGKAYLEAGKKYPDTTALKQEQRAWLKERNKCGNSDCLRNKYQERIAVLSQASEPLLERIMSKDLSLNDYRVVDRYNDSKDLLAVRMSRLQDMINKEEWKSLLEKTDTEWREYRDALCKLQYQIKQSSSDTIDKNNQSYELECRTGLTSERNNRLENMRNLIIATEDFQQKLAQPNTPGTKSADQDRNIELNHELEEIVNVLMKRLRSNIDEGGGGSTLEEMNKEWHEYRDSQCLFKYQIQLSFDGSANPDQEQERDMECLNRFTQDHINQLKTIRDLVRIAMVKQNVAAIKLDQQDLTGKYNDLCKLDNVPANTQIYVVSLYSGLTNSDIQLGESGHTTKEVEVVVSKQGTPVILALMAYDPVVWKISKTKEANIVAVIVGGYHTQAVVGISPETPVKYFVYETKGMCKYFYAYKPGKELDQAIQRINQITGSDNITILTEPTIGRYYVGAIPTENDEIIGIKDVVKKKEGLPSGQKGLDLLVQQGKLRQATKEDIEKWVDKASARYLKYGNGLRVEHYMEPSQTYVVIADFDLPNGLAGAHSRFFIIPEDQAMPGGPKGHNTFYLMKYGSCTGAAPDCSNR